MGMPGAVTIQEQVKYVEIVPNEGIAWKVLTGLTFLLVMFLMITPVALGIPAAKDDAPMAQGMAGASYSLYLKGPNQQPVIAQSQYETPDEAQRDKPEPFSVGTNADDIIWPGMKIIRTIDGYAVGSSSVGGGEDMGPEEDVTDE